MLQALALDPALTQKRLGDGFYEQKLIREQVASLTGWRFLDGYASDEAQYRALMEQGVLFARAHQLVPGVALTAEQMAQLTSDIVWLVERMVTLPDGTTTRALVPQVYVRLQDGDLAPTGALLAGDSLDLNLTGDLANGGTLLGRNVLSLAADNVANLGRIQGGSVSLAARQDFANLGGTIQAGDSLTVSAGRDLTVQSTTLGQSNAQGGNTTLDRIAGLYVTNPGGTLLASAGRDMSLVAAQVAAAGSATLVAGNDLKLGTATFAGYTYPAGGVVDRVFKAFGGPHDLIGGQLPGLYDGQGNIKEGMTKTESTGYDIWSGLAIAPSVPFAAATLIPPEVWKAISILLGAAK
ncbi:MAG: S-layer family protein [Gammaproteobacteria bacterium]|nr:S-layer family protein [Gammaproteobacteria bacterium]MBU1647023.1 S-layer family protein [Gammaproteobacteria bacterium]MBU1972535.1 S-layer family protein [Gammaproteobacteria bacterium]